MRNKINKKKCPQISWVEKLHARDLIVEILLRFFCNRALYYAEYEETFFARHILALFKKYKFSMNISAVCMSLEKKHPNGQVLVYQVKEDIIFCCNKFIEQYAADRNPSTKNTINCYISNAIYNKVAFAAIVISKIKSSDLKYNFIRFEKHAMNQVIIPFYRDKGCVVEEFFSVFGYFRGIERLVKLVAILIQAKVLPHKVKSNISNLRPSIWVEYIYKSVIDFTFWKNMINRTFFEIVYYLDRKDTPIVPRIMHEIDKAGVRWIDAHPEALASNVRASIIVDFVKCLFKQGNIPFFFKIFDCERSYWLLAYTTYFKKYKVKILIQHQEVSWKQDVQKEAIESTGGIMLGFHWSNYPQNMEPTHLFPQHVFFIWGKIIEDFLPEKETSHGYLIPSGVWLSKSRVGLDKIIKYLKGFKFAFTIFDSSAAHNIHQTPTSLSSFYTKLLDLLENNISWGAVVKGKNGNIDSLKTLPSGNDLTLRFEQLVNQKRVFFLNSQSSPVVAAGLTDISVCYGLNSAGILAGVYGYKALHWDCSGWTQYPFYQDWQHKILFNTLDELENAIIMSSNGDNLIGDFSKWKQQFNYFNDFNAAKRVGEFIQDVMDISSRINNSLDIVKIATRNYIERNNIKHDFFNDSRSLQS
jgi:hypothetical protein